MEHILLFQTYLSNSVLETDNGRVPVLILFPAESSPSEYEPPSPRSNGSMEPSLWLLLPRRDVEPRPECVEPRIPEAKEWGTLFLLCLLLMDMCSDIALLAWNIIKILYKIFFVSCVSRGLLLQAKMFFILYKSSEDSKCFLSFKIFLEFCIALHVMLLFLEILLLL